MNTQLLSFAIGFLIGTARSLAGYYKNMVRNKKKKKNLDIVLVFQTAIATGIMSGLATINNPNPMSAALQGTIATEIGKDLLKGLTKGE